MHICPDEVQAAVAAMPMIRGITRIQWIAMRAALQRRPLRRTR